MKKKNLKKPIISALEQRILFDGAAVATAVDVLDETSFSSNNDNTQTATNSNDVTQTNTENSVHEAQAVQGFERDRKEVAFVDVTVSDYQTLVDGVAEGVEIYLVSSLDDINTILENQKDIDAIHILSHGNTGEISVGNDILNQSTLNNFDAVLQTMKNSLSENGDILLYGCNVASDGSGQEFINSFAEITQADVAASNDLTGNSDLGGDWDLEVTSGTIDTEEIVVDNYSFVLGTESSIIMNNGYVKTAISTDGTLGIGSTGKPGIQYDSDGGGDDYLDTADYLTPGTPQELFSIKYDGNLLTNNNANYTSPAIPTIISGDTNQVVAVSTTSDGKLEITQVYSLPEGAKVLTVTVSIKNISSSTVTGVKYLRSTDPDVDSNGLAGSTANTNNFRGSTVNSAENFVYAVGPVSGRVIGLYSSDATTHNTSVSSWTTDPDVALAGGNVGNGDKTIDLGFNLGDLSAGATGSFSFLYVFADTVPEAESHIATAESNNAPTQTTIPTQNLLEDFPSYTIDLKDYFDDVETSDADLNYFYSGNTNIAVSITNGVATISSLTNNWSGTENITFSAKDPYGKSVSQSVAFNVVANQAPDVTTPSAINITDSTGATIIGDKTGTIVASDNEGSSLTYSIDDSSTSVQSLVGTYGTLTIDNTTGEYVYSADSTAINALDSNTTESFTINVSDGAKTTQTTLTINITANAETAATYTEQDSETLILTDTVIDTTGSYGGGYMDFDVSDPSSSETLSLLRVTTADITNGAISIIGNSVYLGDGTTAKVIGQIDGTYNGENGNKLRVNFSVDFTNGDFENSTVGAVATAEGSTIYIEGWTIVNDRAILGVTQIAGLMTPKDSNTDTYPTNNFTEDSGSASGFDYNVNVAAESGDKSIQMNSNGTSDSYGVIRGPYVYSTGNVSLEVGDEVSFDWKAQGGSDAYDVFGYIVNVNDASDYQIILDQTGANASASTPWTTETVTVDSAGEYKFVFLSGTFDATGGTVLGAQLYIDDVKVTQANPPSSLTSNVLEEIAKKVTYTNSSDLTATNGVINKTVTITTVSGDDIPITNSSTKALNILEINDAPVVTTPNVINITEGSGATIVGTITDTLIANDADSSSSLTYSIDDGTNLVQTLTGLYGVLTINSATGEYTYTPNMEDISALTSNVVETFTLNVSDSEVANDQQTTLTINITATNDTSATYIEQNSPTLILGDTIINTQESYSGGYVEFDLNNSTVSETLGIQKVTTADVTNGAISIIGNSVYLGDGTTAKVIGQIDGTYNGENGNKLRINFSVDFTNGDFNSSNSTVGLLSSTTNEVITIDGWNIVNGRINLGVDTIDGLATPEDTTNPPKVISAIDKDGDSLRRETYYTYINNDGGDDNSIKMNSNLTSTNGYAIIRGPYIYSNSAVSLKVGDTVSFDWKAQGGSDAYDVFGYIIDVNDETNYQIILNETGADARATTSWTTEGITVTKDGDYQFVFVSGSWDATGGMALGAQLYIDDVKVTQANPTNGLTSDVLEKIAQKVTYQNSSDLSANNSIINKTVTITTSSGDTTPIVHSSTKELNIQEVNDNVTLVSNVTNIYYTDTDKIDNFPNTTGKLTATDNDTGTTFTYGIDGSTSNGDGTVSKMGAYGTLTVDTVTGEYTFVPDSNVINAQSSNVTETFTFNVSDGSGSTDSKILTINIESVNDAPLLGGDSSNPTFVENGSAVQIDPTITITDLEGTSYDKGFVSFVISQNVQTEDNLTILNIAGISTSGNDVLYGSTVIGTIDSSYNGQNGKELRVNLNSNAYSSEVQALARAIAFSNPTDDLSLSNRTVEIKISDGGNGGDTDARYSTKEAIVSIQTINDLPQIDLSNDNFIVEKSITLNPNGLLSLDSMISFSDLDGDTLTVKLETTNYGLISINDSILNGLTSSDISGNNSRIVTLTGTIEQINNTLSASNGISYTAGFGNDFITPGADYLKITATDDLGGVASSQKLVMVLPAVPNAYSDNVVGKEDSNILIDVDSLILDVNDTNINYTFGTGTPDITDINGNVTTAGTITAFDSSKYIYADFDINNDGNIDSTDTSKVIGFELTNGKLLFNNDKNLVDNSDFGQFTFIPNENWSGVETFLYKFSSDQKTSNIGQISIFVAPVNDAPVISIGNSSITINEDNSFVFDNTNTINLADIDIVDSTQILDLTLMVNEGKLELSQLSGLTVLEGKNDTSIIKVQGSLADLQNAINNLKYTPNQDYNGLDTLTIKLNDNGNSGEGGVLEDIKTISININPINDAPVFTNQSENTIEGNTITGVLPASDVDSTSISFSINGTAPTGFILNSDGSYSFDASSYDYIAEGETDTIIIPISVTDTEGLVTTSNFSITITGTNDAPTVSFENIDSEIAFGQVYNKDISSLFSDKDLTDEFRFEATNLPLGLTIDSTTGIISGRAVESGNFVITIKGTDPHGASISRTYNMLVIAPPQIVEPAKPVDTPFPNGDTNSTSSTDGLNNFTDNDTNLGVLNFNFSDGLSIDTGNGFINPQNGNTGDDISSISNSNTSNTKDLVEANVDLNVLTSGQIVFNEGNKDSFSIVGITIEEIKYVDNYIEIKIVDTNISQSFIVTQLDGTALPTGLFFDPKTGNITGIIPEDLEKLEISIKSTNLDGTTKVLNLKLDLKELKKSQANQAEVEEKYIGLKEQIALENQKLDGYGSYLTRLFA